MEEKRETESVDTSGPNISDLIPLMLTNSSTSLANLKVQVAKWLTQGTIKQILLLVQT